MWKRIKSLLGKIKKCLPEKTIESLQDNFEFIVIILFLFIISRWEAPLEHLGSLTIWILLLGTIGLVNQLIFPKIPLRIGRILAYSIAIILFLITLVFISNKKFVEVLIVNLERKINTNEIIKEVNTSINSKSNKVGEVNGSK